MTDETTPECVVHPYDFDPDCEFCVEEVEFMQRRTAKVMKGNEQAEIRIGYIGARLDPGSILAMRLGTFIEFCTAHNPKMRAKYEQMWAMTLGEALIRTEDEANRARLIANPGQGGGLIVPQ